MHRSGERKAMRRADDTDGNGIGYRTAADRDQGLKPVTVPRAARDLDEGAALRGGFQVTFTRRCESRGEFSDLAQRSIVGARGANRGGCGL